MYISFLITLMSYTTVQYLEQMADAIQKGIEAAQQDLVKDAEEKLLEEVNGIFDVVLIFKTGKRLLLVP